MFDLSEVMRGRGWLVPAYRMPTGMEDVTVLRIVVRDDLSRELAASLMEDLRRAVERLERTPAKPSEESRTGFHH